MRGAGPASASKARSPTARPAPRPDSLTTPFWEAVAAGSLKIQHCDGCETYFHPPVGICPTCLRTDLPFTPVSGRGVLYSFTLTRSGARHPAFVARTPYVVALVELAEQTGLLLFSNLPESDPGELEIGLPVEFYADVREDGVAVPEFRLVALSSVQGLG
ncbi:MAG: OB-fold domain-containing protein [Gammaproteobacteria bacterium]|nr:OB-fold domain-containing protein [Gammaproteobacteria bacterium]